LNGLGLEFDSNNLKAWHRPDRGVLNSEPVGKGNERSYSLREVAKIAALAFIAPHMRYGGLSEASGIANSLADAILQVYATGPDGDDFDKYPVYALTYDYTGQAVFEEVDGTRQYRKIASEFGFRGAVMVAPWQMAAELSTRVDDVLAQRQR